MSDQSQGPPRWRSSTGRYINFTRPQEEPAAGPEPEAPSPRRAPAEEEVRRPAPSAPSEPAWTVQEILDRGVRRRASDIYLSTGQAPRFRIDGEVVISGVAQQRDEQLVRMLLKLLNERDRKTFEETGDVDFSIAEPGLGGFRVNYYRQRLGMGAVFRPIPGRVPPLESLRLPLALHQLIQAEDGLILMTGATGSGKSTTLASLVAAMAQSRALHISTIEDPIEFTIPRGRSVVTQRQVGVHAPSFAQALKSALREDIDVLMVGEMRGLETVSLALEAAETGLLVLATLHTGSSARAVSRIIDIFPSTWQDQVRVMLADCLRAVICQQLVPRADGEGRVPAVEVLMSTPSLAHSIREGRTQNIYTTILSGRDLGMVSMEQALRELVNKGLITEEMALERAPAGEGRARV